MLATMPRILLIVILVGVVFAAALPVFRGEREAQSIESALSIRCGAADQEVGDAQAAERKAVDERHAVSSKALDEFNAIPRDVNERPPVYEPPPELEELTVKVEAARKRVALAKAEQKAALTACEVEARRAADARSHGKLVGALILVVGVVVVFILSRLRS